MISKKFKTNYSWIFIFYFMTVFILNIQSVYGTEPPILHNVEIKSKVTLNERSGLFTYEYEVNNSINSTGNLVALDIDVSYPSGGMALRKDGLLIPYGKSSQTFDQSVPQTAKVIIVPLGMEKPNNWLAGLSVFGTASWGGGDYVQLCSLPD